MVNIFFPLNAESWSEGFLYLIFICGALVNFLPVFLGYTLIEKDSGKYPQYLFDLSSFQFKGSIVASLAASLPLITEHVLDWISTGIIKANKRSQSRKFNQSCLPFREIILLLVIPDLLFLFWIIPFEKYDYMAGLIGARDTMYIFAFLAFMVRLKNPIWTWRSSFSICFSFLVGNILVTVNSQVVNRSATYIAAASVLLPFFISLGFSNLLINSIRWLYYVITVEGLDKADELRNSLCNVHVAFYTLFILGDWLIFYVPTVPSSWTNTGVNYLTMYTYLMAICTLFLTVLSNRLIRIEANEGKVLKDVIYTDKTLIAHERFLSNLLACSCSCGTSLTKYALRLTPR